MKQAKDEPKSTPEAPRDDEANATSDDRAKPRCLTSRIRACSRKMRERRAM